MHLTYIFLSLAALAAAYNPIFGSLSSQACQNCVDGAFDICARSANFASCLCLTTGLGAAQLIQCAAPPGACAANTVDVAQILFGEENYCVQYYPREYCTSPVYIKSVCATATRTTVQSVASAKNSQQIVPPTTSSSTAKLTSVALISSQTRATSTSISPKTSASLSPVPTTSSQSRSTSTTTSPKTSASPSPSDSSTSSSTSSSTLSSTRVGSITSSVSASAASAKTTSGASAATVKDRLFVKTIFGVCVFAGLDLWNF